MGKYTDEDIRGFKKITLKVAGDYLRNSCSKYRKGTR